mmetsp:Transcript_90454/g.258798  ORF Transcript_90454/g.258798 Transcript_90454/m.258798 type:complete len:228 (-) Transcript_90454:46-729(-)
MSRAPLRRPLRQALRSARLLPPSPWPPALRLGRRLRHWVRPRQTTAPTCCRQGGCPCSGSLRHRRRRRRHHCPGGGAPSFRRGPRAARSGSWRGPLANCCSPAMASPRPGTGAKVRAPRRRRGGSPPRCPRRWAARARGRTSSVDLAPGTLTACAPFCGIGSMLAPWLWLRLLGVASSSAPRPGSSPTGHPARTPRRTAGPKTSCSAPRRCSGSPRSPASAAPVPRP